MCNDNNPIFFHHAHCNCILMIWSTEREITQYALTIPLNHVHRVFHPFSTFTTYEYPSSPQRSLLHASPTPLLKSLLFLNHYQSLTQMIFISVKKRLIKHISFKSKNTTNFRQLFHPTLSHRLWNHSLDSYLESLWSVKLLLPRMETRYSTCCCCVCPRASTRDCRRWWSITKWR